MFSYTLSQFRHGTQQPNMTIGVNISLRDDTMDIDSQNYPQEFFITIASLFYIEAAVQIYKKHKNNLEPLYIFELNTLVSIAMVLLCTASKWVMDWNISSSSSSPPTCPINQWLIHYSKLNFSVGTILSQLDRFLALHWHTKYKEIVTPGRAI